VARIEESVDIKRPSDMVFNYTTDASSWPRWQTILPQAEQTSPGPVAVGTTFKGIVRMMGLSMKWTARTTEHAPYTRYGKTIDSMALINEQHNTYSPIDGGTKFTIVYDLKIRGIFKLMSPVLVSRMRKELEKSLANLKGVLEVQR
jgi:ligand-binding SRPBCC domain-containing protein